MKRLTDKQRQILSTIRTIRDKQVRELTERYPGCMPSQWVSAEHLRSAFGITGDQLRAIEKKGELQICPSGGWGPEVFVEGN